MKSVADLTQEYAAAKEVEKAAILFAREILKQLDEAKVREASHPWLGKRLMRDEQSWRTGKIKKLIGTLTVYERSKHIILRGLYGMTDGDLFVLSDTGKSAWSFGNYRDPGEKLWALVDEETA